MARAIVLFLLAPACLWSNTALGEDEQSAQDDDPQVEVVGRRPVRDEREPEVASSIIDGERLRQPGLEFAEALRGESSVQINQVGGAADLSTTSIRGSSSAQVPVYLAGVRLNDDVVGVADLSAVPSFMIHRAIVYQSAPPLHLSRSGFSGALVIEPRYPNETKTHLSAQTGSFSSGSVAAGVSVRREDLSTSLSVRRSGARNDFRYRDDRGTSFDQTDDGWVQRKNADFTQTDLWSISRFSRSDFQVHLIAQGLLREQGVTGLSLLPAQNARASLDRGLVGLSTRVRCAFGSWSCHLRVSTGVSTTLLSTRDPEAELFVVQGTVHQRNQRLSQDLRWSVTEPSGWTFESSLGVEASRLHSDSLPSDALQRRAQEVFATAEGSLGKALTPALFVRGAARVQCLRALGSDVGFVDASAGESTTQAQCLPGGRVGASYRVHRDVKLRTSGIYGVRFATLGERYGISSSMRGNPELRAERGFGVDAGVSWERASSVGNVLVESSGYFRSTRDVIAYQRVALGYVRPANLERGRFFGADLRAEFDTTSWVRTSAKLSLLDARRVSEGSRQDYIPFRSNFVGQFELEAYADDLFDPVNEVSAGAVLYHRGARYADPANLIEIPPQTSLDLYTRLTLVDSVRARFRVENVTQASRFDALGYPLPGRGFYLGVDAEF